ncbi:hypothetical protein HHK36_017115 [Tetracentron sinense]|uniref:Translation initiation factor eIF2B subunit gamma n=1 Tax=Tetracentron sinense TaxID=13715 RepID=A0A834YYW4_TETSI|nr:hypothetical protein HHK36_017115 [Tetracentron sinense]
MSLDAWAEHVRRKVVSLPWRCLIKLGTQPQLLGADLKEPFPWSEEEEKEKKTKKRISLIFVSCDRYNEILNLQNLPVCMVVSAIGHGGRWLVGQSGRMKVWQRWIDPLAFLSMERLGMVVQKSWNLPYTVGVKIFGGRLFLFVFPSSVEANWILQSRKWAFGGYCLLLDRWVPGAGQPKHEHRKGSWGIVVAHMVEVSVGGEWFQAWIVVKGSSLIFFNGLSGSRRLVKERLGGREVVGTRIGKGVFARLRTVVSSVEGFEVVDDGTFDGGNSRGFRGGVDGEMREEVVFVDYDVGRRGSMDKVGGEVEVERMSPLGEVLGQVDGGSSSQLLIAEKGVGPLSRERAKWGSVRSAVADGVFFLSIHARYRRRGRKLQNITRSLESNLGSELVGQLKSLGRLAYVDVNDVNGRVQGWSPSGAGVHSAQAGSRLKSIVIRPTHSHISVGADLSKEPLSSRGRHSSSKGMGIEGQSRAQRAGCTGHDGVVAQSASFEEEDGKFSSVLVVRAMLEVDQSSPLVEGDSLEDQDSQYSDSVDSQEGSSDEEGCKEKIEEDRDYGKCGKISGGEQSFRVRVCRDEEQARAFFTELEFREEEGLGGQGRRGAEETKLEVMNDLVVSVWDNKQVDWVFVPSVGSSGGQLGVVEEFDWIFISAYGPNLRVLRFNFWAELEEIPARWQLPWDLYSVDWIDNFPNIIQEALAYGGSDHRPIFLRESREHWKNRPFKFENMWLQAEGFKELANNWVDKRMREIELRIKVLEEKGENDGLKREEEVERLELSGYLISLRRLEEIFWKQKAKVQWLKVGNEAIEGDVEIGNEVKRYFQNRFLDDRRERPHIQGLRVDQVSKVEVGELERRFEEDGCWEVVKADLMRVFDEFHERGRWKEAGATFISLILKANGADELKDFRPISLVTSLYKIVVKILADRLKKVVGAYQGAFVKGRQLVDDVLIASECIDSGIREGAAGLVCQVDMEKVYDHVDWRFLEGMLILMGFGKRWISSRGLRQGCPLSPFLFIIVAEAFSKLLSKAEEVDGDQVANMRGILRCFEALSGLEINIAKRVSPRSTVIWDLVVERVERRLAGWKKRFLSLRGPKELGGLGFRRVKCMNKALLGKWIWCFNTDKTALWRRVIKDKFGACRGWGMVAGCGYGKMTGWGMGCCVTGAGFCKEVWGKWCWDGQNEYLVGKTMRYGKCSRRRYVGVAAVPEDVGTAGALRAVAHHLTANDILVVSGDLVCDVLPGAVAAAHRRHDAVVTAMLCAAPVSGPSETGSSVGKDKAKKPGRYNIIGLDPTRQFLLFVATGAEVEKDIRVQKSILRAVGKMEIRADLMDAHLYAFKRSVLQEVLNQKDTFQSIKQDVVPYLVRSQLRSEVSPSSAPNAAENWNKEAASQNNQAMFSQHLARATIPRTHKCCAYIANKSKYCARLNSIQAYCDINRDVIGDASHISGYSFSVHNNIIHPSAELGSKTTVGPQCMLGEGSQMGDKCSVKRSVIGRHCRIGSNVKVVNSVVMNHVTIGDGCSIQGSVICSNVQLQERVVLKDCQVGVGFVVTASSEYKGEALARKEK